MKKVPSLFQRNYDGDRLIRDEVTPGCEWVLDGEGIATVKWDGTACMVKAGVLYKRYDAKKGKTPPEGFLPCETAPDAHTGHWPGWLPVGDGAEDRWHRDVWMRVREITEDGTYELTGPKVQGNSHHWDKHYLLRHGSATFVTEPPRPFDELRAWFEGHAVEGIVFHHQDGRMAKVKRRDFGLPWPIRLREEKGSPDCLSPRMEDPL
jgi:hypothetical protein